MDHFATASIFIYTLSIAVLGGRMLVTFLHRGAPTGLLGIALLFGGAPVLAFSQILVTIDFGSHTFVLQLLESGFLISAGIAGVCVMRFTHEVYHPQSRLLPWLTGAACTYFAVAVCTIPFGEFDPFTNSGHSALGLGVYLLLLAIFSWTSAEAYRYWRIYRRVPELDPFVVDRFRMWGIAAAAIIPVVALDSFAREIPIARGLSGIFGLICTVALWLAFLPPGWYRRRLAPQPPGEWRGGGA